MTDFDRLNEALDTETRARIVLAILAQHGPLMSKEAGRNYAGSGSSDDFLMDLLVKLMTSPPDGYLVEYGQPLPDRWIKRAIANRRTDAYRRENRHARILRERASEAPWLSGNGASSDSAETVALRRLDEADILRHISRLPTHLRDIALLRYHDYTAAEIGRMLGVKAATVRKRLQAIRSARIRRALGL